MAKAALNIFEKNIWLEKGSMCLIHVLGAEREIIGL